MYIKLIAFLESTVCTESMPHVGPALAEHSTSVLFLMSKGNPCMDNGNHTRYAHEYSISIVGSGPRPHGATPHWSDGIMRYSLAICLILIIVLWAGAPRTFAANIYFAASTQGSNNGTSCANAYAITDPTYGINVSSNWVAGNTLHICGTITYGPGGTAVTAKSSGSSGSPITIKFEANAILEAPYFANTAAINLNNASYITVDGGTNGIIENTANGTSLTYQQSSSAINALPCNNCEFKNLTISNIYVHVANESEASCSGEVDQTTMNAMKFSGQNVLVHNNTINDAGFALWDDYGNNDTNHQIYSNSIYDIDHAITFAGNGSSGVSLGELIHDNHFYNFANWDTGMTADCFHHDGIHAYGGLNTAPAMSLYVYNNQCDGNLGTNFNACAFFEGGNTATSGTPWCGGATNCPSSFIAMFNNFFITNGSHTAMVGGGGTGNLYVNNTIIGGGNAGDISWQTSATASVKFKNNAEQSLGYFQEWGTSFTVTTPSTDVAGNAYAACVGYNCFSWNTTTNIDTSSFSTWQSKSAGDVTQSFYNSSSLGINTTTGLPTSTSSPLVQAGINLTSLCSGNLAPLCYDKLGNPRPKQGNWDIGAYQYYYVAAPSGLTGTLQQQP